MGLCIWLSRARFLNEAVGLSAPLKIEKYHTKFYLSCALLERLLSEVIERHVQIGFDSSRRFAGQFNAWLE